MLLPYRAKNPTRTFPYATLSLITINVVIYIFTTDFLISIKKDIIYEFSFALTETPLSKFFTSIFLHAEPFHLIGNMLFLWVFGPSVEEKLGWPKFLFVYFVTGFAGAYAQAIADKALVGTVRPCIGASGCIMGILGAYFYLYPWSTVCVFYLFGIYIWGTWNVKAIWIILIFIIMDLFEGILYARIDVSGGVANFAHLGGTALGMMLCYILQATPEKAEVSDVKAFKSDVKDYYKLPFEKIEVMLKDNPDDPELLRAAFFNARLDSDREVIDDAFRTLGPNLLEKDPRLVVYYLTEMQGDVQIYHPLHLLRLATICERDRNPDDAFKIYMLIKSVYANYPECETALYRAALCSWKYLNNAASAKNCIDEMRKRFPNGQMSVYAETLDKQITNS